MSDANISPAAECVCLVRGLVTAAAMLLCCCVVVPSFTILSNKSEAASARQRVLAADTAGYLCPAPAAWQSLHSGCRNVSITQMRHQNVLLLGVFMYSFTLHVKPGSRDE